MGHWYCATRAVSLYPYRGSWRQWSHRKGGWRRGEAGWRFQLINIGNPVGPAGRNLLRSVKRSATEGDCVTRLYGSDIRMGRIPGCGSCMIKRLESKSVYCPDWEMIIVHHAVSQRWSMRW
jgi:hypothetical protein